MRRPRRVTTTARWRASWVLWLAPLGVGCVGGAPSEPTFTELDRNHDLRVGLDEAEALGRRDVMDADGNEDGFVSQSEFARYREALATPLPPPAVAIAPRPEEMVVGAPSDPERTQRAREVYLSGVRLLALSPPKIDEAIREFQQALTLDPLFYKAHFKLGICYYHRALYDLEINEYRKCLAINRQYTPAWLNLGHAHLARDELERAREAYQQVLEFEPNHSVALYNKALVEFDLQNEEESLRLFRGFLEVDGQGEMADRARSYIKRLEERRLLRGGG